MADTTMSGEGNSPQENEWLENAPNSPIQPVTGSLEKRDQGAMSLDLPLLSLNTILDFLMIAISENVLLALETLLGRALSSLRGTYILGASS